MHLFTDQSYAYGGFRAVARLRSKTDSTQKMDGKSTCEQSRFWQWNESCFLFSEFPPVSLKTAKQICHDLSARLLPFEHLTAFPALERLLRSLLEQSFPDQPIIWLNNDAEDIPSPNKTIKTNPKPVLHVASVLKMIDSYNSKTRTCAALTFKSSSTNAIFKLKSWNNRFNWIQTNCDRKLPFICWKPTLVHDETSHQLQIIYEASGSLKSPAFPASYSPFSQIQFLLCPFSMCSQWTSNQTASDLDQSSSINQNQSTFVYALRIDKLQLEEQRECLYDWLEISPITIDQKLDQAKENRLCGRWNATKLNQAIYFTGPNQSVFIRFQSDHSIQLEGFDLRFERIDLEWCAQPSQTIELTSKEQTVHLQTPTFERRMVPNLDCELTITAPTNHVVMQKIANFLFDIYNMLTILSTVNRFN